MRKGDTRMMNSAKIHAFCDGYCLILGAYSRDYGRKGFITVGVEASRKVLVLGSVERWWDWNCGGLVEMFKKNDMVRFHVRWQKEDHGIYIEYDCLDFALPEDLIWELLAAEEWGLQSTADYLYCEQHERRTKFETDGAADTLRNVLRDKRKRRALSKALRDCFRDFGGVVRLYSDSEYNFCFETEADRPLCGGLKLIRDDDCADDAYKYVLCA